MQGAVTRPTGIVVIAILVALKGVASLAMVFDLLRFDRVTGTLADELAAAASSVVALALLWKAYGLWSLHRVAWLATVVLVALDGVAAVCELLVGAHSETVWFSLAGAVVVELYLLQPSVRQLFSADHAGP